MPRFRNPCARTYLLTFTAFLFCASATHAWEKIMPYHFGRYPVPPSVYGYPLDDRSAGYYGGMNYRQYNSFGRGYLLADFPGSVPAWNGRWTKWRYWPYSEDERVPWLRPHNQAAPNGACRIIVETPPNAEVWLEGRRSKQSGAVRTYYSPPLPRGKEFVYQVRARWREGTIRREQTREVTLRSGNTVLVQFTQQGQTAPASLPSLRSPPALDESN